MVAIWGHMRNLSPLRLLWYPHSAPERSSSGFGCEEALDLTFSAALRTLPRNLEVFPSFAVRASFTGGTLPKQQQFDRATMKGNLSTGTLTLAFRKSIKNWVIPCTLMAALGWAWPGRVLAQSFTVLHTFSDDYYSSFNSDGANPQSRLVLSGNTL